MSGFLGERLDAEKRLRELGPQAVDSLLALMLREQRKLRIRRRIYAGIVGSFALFGLPLAGYLTYRGIITNSGDMIGSALGAILGGWGGGLVGGTVALIFPSHLHMA